MDVSGRLSPLPPGKTRYDVIFDSKGHVGGSSGCNDYGGTYGVKSGKHIKIEIGVVTLVGCPESLESRFWSLLENAKKYKIDKEGRLLLYPGGSKNPTLIFIPDSMV